MFFLFPPMFALKTFPTDKSFFAFFVIERRASAAGAHLGDKKSICAYIYMGIAESKCHSHLYTYI